MPASLNSHLVFHPEFRSDFLLECSKSSLGEHQPEKRGGSAKCDLGRTLSELTDGPISPLLLRPTQNHRASDVQLCRQCAYRRGADVQGYFQIFPQHTAPSTMHGRPNSNVMAVKFYRNNTAYFQINFMLMWRNGAVGIADRREVANRNNQSENFWVSLFTHEALSERIGASRESVTRTLAKWKPFRVIRKDHRRVYAKQI